MRKLVGKRLDGRYEFIEVIGVGGMADVYRAYDNLKKTYVAIKVLKDKYSKNKEFLYRFKNESKANASLSHPNIVRIFDVGFGNSIQYIVMEYVEGITLKEFIEKAKVLNWKDVVHFVFQILRGLQHAHDKGIVHRDIKPQNIMLLEDGTVKIMDFGIARFPRDEKINSKKTVGSVYYISPEQASGGITDFKSDIYSVGIMMYEMLTGVLPFEGKTPEIVAEKQINEHPKSPLKLNPSLPQGLVEIIFKAIKKKPEERYQSATEMLRDVDEFKQDPNIRFGYVYSNDIDATKSFNLNPYGLKKKKSFLKRSAGLIGKNEKLIPILSGVTIAFFLAAIIMVLTFVFGRGRSPITDIKIPNFVGHNIEDVKTMDNGKYKDLGYTIKYEPNSDHEAGVIIEQSVKPDTQVKSNYGNMVFIVSSGIEKKTIPDVVGLPVSKAEAKLKKAGFINIKKIEKVDEEAPLNTVLAIEPRAFTEIAYDSTIRLYCSASENDEKIVEVPSVVGKTLEEAKYILKNAGFDVSVRETSSNNKTYGIIIEQNKEKATLGSVVEIVLNVNENRLSKNNENGQEKKFNYKDFFEDSIKIPLKSSSKIEDVFEIAVIDEKKNVVSRTEGAVNKNVSLNVNVKDYKNANFKVIIKNKRTGKTAKYGFIKIVTDDAGNRSGKSSFNSDAFYETLD